MAGRTAAAAVAAALLFAASCHSSHQTTSTPPASPSATATANPAQLCSEAELGVNTVSTIETKITKGDYPTPADAATALNNVASGLGQLLAFAQAAPEAALATKITDLKAAISHLASVVKAQDAASLNDALSTVHDDSTEIRDTCGTGKS